MTQTVLRAIEQHRLFGQRSAAVRVAPFALAYLAAFALYPVGDGATFGWSFAAAVLLAALTVAALGVAPSERLPAALQLLPLVVYLGSIVLLRHAHGGAASGYTPLVLVAVVWAAVFGTARTLAAVVAAVGLALAGPVLVLGAPEYPLAELRRGVLTVLTSALVGAVIQILIGSLVREFRRRDDAERRLNRLRAAEIHDDIVQSLTAAQLGLTVGDTTAASLGIRDALARAQSLAADLLVSADDRAEPGSLRRTTAPAYEGPAGAGDAPAVGGR